MQRVYTVLKINLISTVKGGFLKAHVIMWI